MRIIERVKPLIIVLSLCLSMHCAAGDGSVLQGTWRMMSYFNAGNQVRYASEGYMMFGEQHWLHLAFLNRDPRPEDFAEAHHGTYRITGPDTLDLYVDLDLHMDPKREFQDEPVWYGPVDDISGARYRIEGDTVTIDLPSSAQIVMQRLE